jgi:hypothetical protein
LGEQYRVLYSVHQFGEHLADICTAARSFPLQLSLMIGSREWRRRSPKGSRSYQLYLACYVEVGGEEHTFGHQARRISMFQHTSSLTPRLKLDEDWRMQTGKRTATTPSSISTAAIHANSCGLVTSPETSTPMGSRSNGQDQAKIRVWKSLELRRRRHIASSGP